MPNIRGLVIDRVIVHEVFQREETGPRAPELSDGLAELEDRALNSLQDRIISVVGRDSACLEMTIHGETADALFQHLASMLDSEMAEFIEKSHDVARRLTQAQGSRAIPGGILVVFDGSLADGRRVIGVMKAEMQDGFIRQRNNRRAVLQYLSELVLTPNQRFYKLGLFIEKEPPEEAGQLRTAEDFSVYVYDDNLSKSSSGQVATYFSQVFLNCRPSENARTLTQNFFLLTREWINTIDVEEDHRLDLLDALHTYLKVDQARHLSVRDFGQRYIAESRVRDQYTTFMRASGFPATRIEKELVGILSQLKTRKIKFPKDTISGPPDGFNDRVTITEDDEGTTVRFASKIQSTE